MRSDESLQCSAIGPPVRLVFYPTLSTNRSFSRNLLFEEAGICISEALRGGVGRGSVNYVIAMGLERDLMAQQRKRSVKQTATFEERLAEEARKFKEAAEKEAPGSMARELLLRRVRQAELASSMLASRGFQQ
jgi:hypothetical protein